MIASVHNSREAGLAVAVGLQKPHSILCEQTEASGAMAAGRLLLDQDFFILPLHPFLVVIESYICNQLGEWSRA